VLTRAKTILNLMGSHSDCFNCSAIYSIEKPSPTQAADGKKTRHGARKFGTPFRICMGGCLSSCLGGARDEGRDPILDAQTRQRAAEAAEARQAKFASSAQGKAAAKQASRERTSTHLGRDAHQQRIADIIS